MNEKDEAILWHKLYKEEKLDSGTHQQPSLKTLEMFDGMKDNLNEINLTIEKAIVIFTEGFKKNEEDHGRIETQVKKTNGSVLGLKIWQGGITVGITIISVIIGWVWNDYIKTRDNVIEIGSKIITIEDVDNFLKYKYIDVNK